MTKPQLPLTPLSLKIGNYQLRSMPTGLFGLDGGAMFGTVPKVLWQQAIPPDTHNRIPMEARSLLLRSCEDSERNRESNIERNIQRNILIDVGNGGFFTEKYGNKLGPKFQEMYNISTDGDSLQKSLLRTSLTPEQITDVVLTHLHFDHAGGATKAISSSPADQHLEPNIGSNIRSNICSNLDLSASMHLIPSFSNAKYWLQKQNLLTAQKPNIRERSSYFPANFQPLLDNSQLQLLDGPESNFLPGLSCFISNGHTQGHQSLIITDGQTTVVYCGDVIPTSAHVRLAWIMGYDLDSLKIIEEKQRLLSQAAKHGWFLFFEHDPLCELCTVMENGHDFAVKERYVLN